MAALQLLVSQFQGILRCHSHYMPLPGADILCSRSILVHHTLGPVNTLSLKVVLQFDGLPRQKRLLFVLNQLGSLLQI